MTAKQAPEGVASSSQSLLDLAARVEAAEASEQKKLLAEACRLVVGWWPSITSRHADYPQALKFARMLGAEAFESAAMMLVPSPRIEGEYVSIGVWTGPGVHAPHVRARAWVSGSERVLAATPALALCAAALRARAQEQSA